MEDLRYPVGRFDWDAPVPSAQERRKLLAQIAAAPRHLRAAVAGLSPRQLDTPYRSGGWTPRQVAHHVVDSHLNAYTRFKLALTEDAPTIKPYLEDRWARLADTRLTPVATSVSMLELLHERWMSLLRTMTDAEFARTFVHPEMGREVTLGKTLALYAWHGRHHVGHITSLRERMGWSSRSPRSRRPGARRPSRAKRPSPKSRRARR